MNKEAGGVALGFAGFVFLTMAFKGTWTNVWDALIGKKNGNASASSPSSSPIPIGAVTFAGGGGTGATGRPGSPPGSANPFRGAV